MKTVPSNLKTLILSAALVSALGGCAAAVVGGTAGAAASVADRRSTGAQTDDQIMEIRVKNVALAAIRKINPVPPYRPKLIVVSHDRRILLLGQVPTEADKQAAENAAREEKNAVKVYNYIQVSSTGRTLGNSSNDKWITTKVRGNLINIPGVYAGHINVTTYNGIVYVMGILTAEQQNAVNERIRTTPGVQQVVTLYENFN